MSLKDDFAKVDEMLGAEPETGEDTADDWGEPLLFGEIETPEIPCDVLPDPFGPFGAFVAAMTQTPTGLSVMFGLSVLATCLQKKFEVAPFGDEYTEPINLWTVTSLEPGTRKTAVKNEMTRPVTDWERGKAEEMKATIRENAHIIDMAKRRIDALKTKVAKPSTEDTDRDDLMQQIFKIETEMPGEIHAPRLWTDDVTAERLQALLVDHGERMSLISDEGGLFEVMAGLYSGGKFNNNVFLQSHAGSPVRVDRQGRTVTLNKPSLTFGLAIQPSVLSDLGQGNKTRFRGNGTLARFLYCLPKSTVGRRNVALHKQIPEQVRSAYYAKVSCLLDIPKIYDEQGRERARILTLTPTAKTLWLDFAQDIENRLGAGGDLYSVQDWGGKLPGAVLRIAGLFHVAEHGETTPAIGDQTMTQAISLGGLLIPHAKAAFGQMGDDEAVSDAKIILQWLMNSRLTSFTQREAYRRFDSRIKKVDRLRKALAELVDRHIISPAEKIQTKGRPTESYRVNPKIHETRQENFKERNATSKGPKGPKAPP